MELFFLLYLALFVVAALPAVAAAHFSANIEPKTRYTLVIAIFSTLVAPSLGGFDFFGFTVPIPFGCVILLAILTGEVALIHNTLFRWPLWHLVSFPVTVAVGAFFFRRLHPMNSFKPTSLRGMV